MAEELPQHFFFIPIFLKRDAMDIIKKNHIYYDENTQGNNIGCWLGDITTLNSDDFQKIRGFIIYPDKMSKEFVNAQLLGKI